MTQKTYIVEGRQFRTQTDYNRAIHDKEIIDKLREKIKGNDITVLRQLSKELHNEKYTFYTLLGQDFREEIDERIKRSGSPQGKKSKSRGGRKGKPGTRSQAPVSKTKPGPRSDNSDIDTYVEEVLKKKEKRRKLLILFCSAAAVGCLGYFGLYSYYIYRTDASYEQLSALKENTSGYSGTVTPVIHYDSGASGEAPEVLDEYKNLLIKNKRLIGWVKIDDTNIDYPVMQTVDNEYYLDHNLNQEYDKNGSIFMDKDCDVLKPSTNLILYGHHMKSGQMFGGLDKYEDEQYGKDHPYIDFDTIYEHGIYQVMYVFRSRVYSEEEIVFKYYQFIDAMSEQEFDSNMQEMAAISLYDTGVTAEYGDRLLTLSTCDYQEKDGRFVVVAKKVTAKE